MDVSELSRRLLKSVTTVRKLGAVDPGAQVVTTVNEVQARDVLRHLLNAAAGFSLVLTEDESCLVYALAERLNVPLTWRWYDLKEGEWHEGRRHDRVTERN